MKSLAVVAFSITLVVTTGIGSARAGVFAHALATIPSPGQVDAGIFEDVWTSLPIRFQRNFLQKGDVLVLDVTFGCRRIKVTDSFINDDESIRFFIGGAGGVGGGVSHTLPYTWEFIAPLGTLNVNPIPGTGSLIGTTGNGLISPNNNLNQRDIDLTGSMFSFGGIKLTVTVPNTIGAPWVPNFVTLAVDGDDIEILDCTGSVIVPEPNSFIVFGTALLFGLAHPISRRHRRSLLRETKPMETVDSANHPTKD